MLLNISLVCFFLLINSFLLASLGTFMFTRRESKGALQLSMLMYVCALWSLTAGISHAAISPADKVFWVKMSYIAIVSMGPVWLTFGAEFSQLKASIIDSIRRLVWTVPIISVVLIFTNELHLLMWPTITPVSDKAGSMLIYGHGILYYLHLAYSYTLLGIGTYLLLRFVSKERQLQNMQIAILCFAILCPWIANILFVFIGSNAGGIDITPFAMTITGVILAFNIIQYKLFMSLPVAKDAVFQGIKSGIVIIDDNLCVIDSNETAKKIFGKSLKNGVDLHALDVPFGKELCEIRRGKRRDTEIFIEHLNTWVDVQFYELADFKAGMEGVILFMYDVTSSKKAHLAAEEAKYLSSSIIDFLPDALFVLDKAGKVVIWNKAMEKMTKVDAAHMIGKGDFAYAVPFYNKRTPGLASYILDESLPIDKKRYKKFTRNEDTIAAEVELGKVVLWAVAKPLYNNDGDFVGAIESIRDITDRRKIENELTERVETLSKVNTIMLKREDRMAEMKRKLEKLETINNSQ